MRRYTAGYWEILGLLWCLLGGAGADLENCSKPRWCFSSNLSGAMCVLVFFHLENCVLVWRCFLQNGVPSWIWCFFFKMVLLTGAKCVFIWCFFFKIVLVSGAKRGGLEVDVCVDDVKWCGVEGGVARGTGWISEEVGTRLVKENTLITAAVYADHFGVHFWWFFLNRLSSTKPFLNCYILGGELSLYLYPYNPFIYIIY